MTWSKYVHRYLTTSHPDEPVSMHNKPEQQSELSSNQTSLIKVQAADLQVRVSSK